MMDVEQKSEISAPFQEVSNTARFFVGGGRGAILHDIKTALSDRVELITLIGEEGSGKTMLCRMLQEQWETNDKVLFLPRIVESFEDVVRVVAQECGVMYPDDANRADAKKIFLDLVATLRSKGESLILICDEAEKMYLATLERIRKILDVVKAEGGGLQVLLAGRKSLSGHIDQLVLCDFGPITEKQFFLSALDDTETWNYLNFCVQDYRGMDQQEVFTKGAADKIASMGRGNLRLINMYADESLQSSNADTSFLVLLDHVKDDEPGENLLAPTSGMISQLPVPPKYLLAGGAALAILMLFVLFRGGDNEKELPLADSQQKTHVVKGGPEVEVEVEVEPVVQTVQKNEIVAVEAVRDVPGLKLEVIEEVVEEVVEVVAVVVPDISKTEPVQNPEFFHVQEIELVENAKENSVVYPSTQNAVDPMEIATKTAGETSKTVQVIPPVILVGKSKRLLLPRIERTQGKKKAMKTGADIPFNPELASFFRIGDKWLAGEMDSSFSIQLMALQSDQAEENLKRIVSKPEYLNVADKLVLLKRPSDPPTLLLFYGVYPTKAAARNARNNMPVFLRDKHPYPVSVRGAVEKARVE